MGDNRENAIVLGERVGGPPLVQAEMDQLPAEPLVKVEPVAQGVLHEGVVQPVITATTIMDMTPTAQTQQTPTARIQQPRGTEEVRRVRPRRSAPVMLQPGVRVRAKFEHDGEQRWFGGVLLERMESGWKVRFDDGDVVDMAEHMLKGENPHTPQPPIEVEWGQRIYNASMQKAVESPPLMQAVESPPLMQADESPPLMQADELPPPIDPPMPLRARADVHLKVEYEEHSCRVKSEHEQQASGGRRQKDAVTLAREALRRKLEDEQGGKTPLTFFRAGCHPKCLTQVLGGVGTDMERIVREDKVLPDGHVLIREGEMYLWGRADWNTYAPSFAGDTGAYRYDLSETLRKQQHSMGWERPQQTFHLFRECTQRFLIDFPLSAYHGKGAEKKTIYCGRYQIDDDVTHEMPFTQLPECTKECVCELSAMLSARRELGSGSDLRARQRRAG
jgi:hypothetical protein